MLFFRGNKTVHKGNVLDTLISLQVQILIPIKADLILSNDFSHTEISELIISSF